MIYDYSIGLLDGGRLNLSQWRGKTMLIVNTASRCGFTPQLAGLEALYQKYHAKGLEILGCPCNQFGAQEPGQAAEIGDFCQKNYGVDFTLSEKIEVNGPGAHPLWTYLKAAQKGVLGSEAIKWNFTKFLVSPEGQVLARYASATKPEALEKDILGCLKAAS